MDDDNKYFHVDLDLGQAFRFQEPTPKALGELQAMLAGMPVRPFTNRGALSDSLDSVTFRGPLESLTPLLEHILVADHQSNIAEIGDICDFEVVAIDSDLQPDALHLVTRITPKDGAGGAILYSMRIQRLGSMDYAMWSDY